MRKNVSLVGGFSLVEVALALGVASFCLITLMALLPVGVQHYHDADAQSAMVNLATMTVRDLQATPNGATALSPRFGFSVPAAGGTASGTTPQTIFVDASEVPAGVPGTAIASSSIYRISVFFLPPSSASARTATLARIWITFPANADPTPTSVPANYVDTFETTVCSTGIDT